MGTSVRPQARALSAAMERNLPPRMRERARDFFAYTIDFIPLAATTTTVQEVNIQSDSDFIIGAAVAVVTDTANTTRLAFVPELVQLFSAASGRNLFSGATHFENVFGTAQEPAIWPIPKLLAAGSTFSAQLQNLEATARNVRLAFLGFKVFAYRD
ncbi:MAG: hypothetical protein ACREJC_09860 [Tepidisphaeraceae bacterium]